MRVYGIKHGVPNMEPHRAPCEVDWAAVCIRSVSGFLLSFGETKASRMASWQGSALLLPDPLTDPKQCKPPQQSPSFPNVVVGVILGDSIFWIL